MLSISFWSTPLQPDTKVEKVNLYPKPVDFLKSIDGLAVLAELDIKVAGFNPVLFVCLNKPRNRVKILYRERNGFCICLKRLDSERFKPPPDPTDVAIVLAVQELNWLLDDFDLWRNRPHQILTLLYLIAFKFPLIAPSTALPHTCAFAHDRASVQTRIFMTLARCKAALLHLIDNQENRVIALSGKWGTGKTELWKQVRGATEDAKAKDAVLVSLFGVSTITELRILRSSQHRPSDLC